MKANVFRGIDKLGIEEVERPRASAGEALIRVSLTTICGTDLHIVRGEYPVEPGRIIGHEAVGSHRRAGRGAQRLLDRRPCAGGCHHPVRAVSLVSVRALFGDRRDGVIKVAIRP
jgi:NADPH:quinone reductase-like Zn-dependent oxidoreductase